MVRGCSGTVRQASARGSAAATRFAISSVTSFSCSPPGPIAPVSVPPCPGSTTIVSGAAEPATPDAGPAGSIGGAAAPAARWPISTTMRSGEVSGYERAEEFGSRNSIVAVSATVLLIDLLYPLIDPRVEAR